MGPLALMDMTGIDILIDSQRVLASALPRHGSLSPIATCLVKRGQLGQKIRGGDLPVRAGKLRTARVVTRPTKSLLMFSGDVATPLGRSTQCEIQERLVLRMVSEAFYVLEEGVARSQSDVDVATVLGTGFPDFRGGVLKYAHDLDFRRSVIGSIELAGTVGRAVFTQ